MSRPVTEQDLYQDLDKIDRRLERLERFGPPAGAGSIPGGGAGGVLAGSYPNPTFAQNMATQAELDAAIASLIASIGSTQSQLTALDGVAVKDGDAAGGVLSGTFPNPSFAQDMATQAELDAAIAGVTSGSTPTGPAGGVLSGTYPNPGFAVDMATQAELNAAIAGITGVSASTTAVYTTASLATNARESGALTMAVGWRVHRVVTNRAARVRLYANTATRDADAARPITTDPPDYPTTGANPGHGCMLEVVTDAAHLDLPIAPNTVGQQLSGSAGIPITVDNLGATGTVIVTIYYQKVE